jgi:hypothetical protein
MSSRTVTYTTCNLCGATEDRVANWLHYKVYNMSNSGICELELHVCTRCLAQHSPLSILDITKQRIIDGLKYAIGNRR